MVVHGDDLQHVVKVLQTINRLQFREVRQLARGDYTDARRDILVIGATIEAVVA
jgi:hypothetical protein